MRLEQFQPHPLLNNYIDSILVQEDFNLINFANRNPVNVLPTTLAVIGIQYGSQMQVIENNQVRMLGTSGITGMQTTFRKYISTGSIGTIIIRFKPGGLTAFTPYPINEFQDINLDLKLIFPPQLVSDMELRLSMSVNSVQRIAIVHAFLWSLFQLNHRQAEPLILEAARQIQLADGDISIKQLAGEYFVSNRTLERKFNSCIGITPKRFANIVRFQKALQLRKTGSDYLDIVHACHFSDHAHFVHDFNAFVGCSPEQFFLNEAQPELAKEFNALEAPTRIKHIMYH